jgi:hypothetical protein
MGRMGFSCQFSAVSFQLDREREPTVPEQMNSIKPPGPTDN